MSERDSANTASIDRLAIVVVTYRRQHLLSTLLDSIARLTVAPWRVVIVDNEDSDRTAAMVESFRDTLTRQWGRTLPDASGNDSRVVYAPQKDNLGGAGGFSAGVRAAYEMGAEWFWVMDDDVAVLPDGIEKLAPWTLRHDVVQASRHDYDGGPFYWQYRFIVPLGIPDPVAPRCDGLTSAPSRPRRWHAHPRPPCDLFGGNVPGYADRRMRHPRRVPDCRLSARRRWRDVAPDRGHGRM